ncbi:MAG: FMN-binding negative transcriptional regulator [Rhodospirillales bacterium]|nr:FMN-binding negative transcriptional regulator [Rhodospirillales bacterium]MDE0380582.1 FMN-binding negative transcriptional regulator [Rhodospirillales bacterium]
MHSNPAFRRVSRDRNLAFAAQRGFGILVVDGAGLLASHIPFVVVDDGAAIHAHLVRSNPIARALQTKETTAVLAVSGPDSYISPDWYGPDAADQVPTWNYVAVHIRGTLRRRPEETLRAHLDALSARFEAELRPKPPWMPAKVSPDRLSKLMRSIMPVELSVEGVDGTWKLNQNKDDSVRLRAARHAESDGYGQEATSLARLMRNPPED